MLLRYTRAGFLFIDPQDDCHAIVNAMLATNYSEEFCISESFNPEFTARLMDAGFLVMSADIAAVSEEEPFKEEPHYISLPKLHLERSALFFENLHIKKSIKKHLNKNSYAYELRADSDFEYIVDRCVEKHGADWLTPPLVESIKQIRKTKPTNNAYPSSFALYKDGKFAAGEFGVICESRTGSKVYTSYSGFYDEPNAGTIQLILTTKYLQENGFSFFDLGMPMDYKNDLGAVNITPQEFVKLFRNGR